jgi:GntR family transcriptional regulator, transcriptional repressor for pyruvate dehydrogenase complex
VNEERIVELVSMRDYRRDATSIEVSRRLLSYLLSGAIEPGQKIPSERMLAEILGVGRYVIREAFKTLTLLGLIDVRQGDGTYLRRPASDLLTQSIQWGLLLGDQQIEELVDARYHLEAMLAELAAGRRSEADLAALRSLLAEMDDAEPNDPNRFIASDLAFHMRIAKAAGNPPLASVLESIALLLKAWMSGVAASTPEHDPSEEHSAIIEAIERGDSDNAGAAMRSHLVAAYERLRSTRGEERVARPSAAPLSEAGSRVIARRGRS